MNAPAPPRILLLEDDPVSSGFLHAVLESLPAEVEAAATLAEARTMTRAQAHALWLFDAHLPDGSGAALLAELRAAGLHTPALAHTAGDRREDLDALIDAGFAEVLVKPLGAAALRDAVQRALGAGENREPDSTAQRTTPSASPCAKFPVWDDDAALRALNGQRAHVEAMREMFRHELPATTARIADAQSRGDGSAVLGELHKLRAGCGFVGAARLGAAVEALRLTPASAEAHARFEAVVWDTLAGYD